MSQTIIVCSQSDGPFARAVGAGLSSHAFSEVRFVPKSVADDAVVLLLWRRALEEVAHAAGHSVDVQALIELWAEERLIVVRRDDTLMPLGMRDLPSLGPAATAMEVAAILQETGASGRRSSLRAPETQARTSAPSASDTPASSERRHTMTRSVGYRIAIGALVVAIGGMFYYYGRDPGTAELVAALELARHSNEQLVQARQAAQSAQKSLELARQAEAEASGDPEKQKPLAALTRLREVELQRQAGLVRQREEEARKVLAAAEGKKNRLQDSEAKKKSSEEKAASDKMAAEKSAQAAAAVKKSVSELPPEKIERVGRAEDAATDQNLLLLKEGKSAEDNGDAKAAIKLYRQAYRNGSGEAAKRIGDIFVDGKGNVQRDYAESLVWYARAEKRGVAVERARARDGNEPAPVPSRDAAPAPAPIVESQPTPQQPPLPDGSSSTATLVVIALASGLGVGYLLSRRRRNAPQALAINVRPAAPGAKTSADESGKLFVSYSHRDKQSVEPIVSQIESMGRTVWMDRTGITGQAGWAGQIVRAIRECKAVVLMASPNSYASDQVVRELYLAMNHKKPIVPIELAPAELPDELQYILAPFQHHRLSGNETKDVLGRALAAV